MVVRAAEDLAEDVYIVFKETGKIQPNRPALVAFTVGSLLTGDQGAATQITHIVQIATCRENICIEKG